MASQQMISAASSSSSSLVSLKKYDVFLSFRGEDTRTNFTSHLYDALNRKKIITFIDDNELQKGDSISPTLTTAIEESYISIVIFSQDYASSKWCLNELVKILECKNDWGQIVIPVFYNIDPSHIRKQTESYQRAFTKHERDMKLNKDMLPKWKVALFEASNLAGFDSSKYRNESDVIKAIVEDVFQKLKQRKQFKIQDKGLVRIDEKCEEVESLLKIRSNDVRILGLWGMGGIGKTIIAKTLYAKLCCQYDAYCLLLNVREESKKHGLIVVRHRLFSALLKEENLRLDAPDTETHLIMRRLSGKKLLIVLDDVADSEQLEYLLIDNNCLGPGSRVIVTTRDKQIIRHVHEIYEVRKLNECDSRELFCLNAFKKKHPKIGYEELSKSAIAYCKGNPLALKVLGTRLGPRSKMAWESDLKKLQEILDVKIHNVLKLSYDDLDHTEKDIFLDIACFFAGGRSDWVTSLLDACGLFATVGMEVLQDKSLITTSSYGVIEMHDLIQEMGREVVNKESMKNPGERSRLWKVEEVVDVLKNNMGIEAVEGIQLDTKLVADLSLSHDSFKRMTKLRYLAINDRCGKCIYFPDGLGWLSDKLRYLQWDDCLLKSLPLTYSAKMLVELHMRSSKLKKLWSGVQDARHLKKIDLSFSEDLIEMPDLSGVANLETVNLSYCKSLRELHPSVLSLPKLEELDLRGCKKMRSLKSNIHSKSLRKLDVSNCSSLVEFSVTSEKMTSLDLDNTAIRELPSSIWCNSKLELLDIRRCYKLNTIGKKLSNDPRIRSLTTLNLRWCAQIDALNLSLLLDGIQSLKALHLSGCSNLETLPHNIHKHSELNYLELDDCTKLVLSSPTVKLPPFLRCLSAFNCNLMDTDTTQRLLFENSLLKIKNGTLQDRFTSKFGYFTYLFIPGDHDHVLGTFDFQKAEGASINIPPIPKSNLKAFMFCILLSKGEGIVRELDLECGIYEDGKQVGRSVIYLDNRHYVELNSDHVLLCLFDCYIQESEGDHYNLSFEFKHRDNEDDKWSTDMIKGCGVHPVYALEGVLELDDKSSSSSSSSDVDEFEAIGDDDHQQPLITTTTFWCSSFVFVPVPIPIPEHKSSTVEIAELESTAQVSDVVDEFEARAIGDDEQQQPSYYPKEEEEEEEEEELNEKSSCDCSIGLLLKYLLERSTDTIIQVRNVLFSISSSLK